MTWAQPLHKTLFLILMLFCVPSFVEDDVCFARDIHVSKGLTALGFNYEIVLGFIDGQLRVSSGNKGSIDKNTKIIEAEKDVLKPYGWGRFMIFPESPKSVEGKRFVGVHVEAEIYKDNHHDLEISKLGLHEILRKPRVDMGPKTNVVGYRHADFLDLNDLGIFFQDFKPAPVALDHQPAEPGRLFFPRDHQGPRWKSLTMLLQEPLTFQSNFVLNAFLITVYRGDLSFTDVVTGGRRVDTCFYFFFE